MKHYFSPVGDRRMSTRGWSRVTWATGLGGAWLVGLVVLAAVGVLPAWVPAVYAVASGVAFVTYAADKARSETGGRRVPERVLHALALAGGWPGAAVAQQWFRHKTRKARFQVVFWLIVAAHVGIAVAWYYFQAGPSLRFGVRRPANGTLASLRAPPTRGVILASLRARMPGEAPAARRRLSRANP